MEKIIISAKKINEIKACAYLNCLNRQSVKGTINSLLECGDGCHLRHSDYQCSTDCLGSCTDFRRYAALSHMVDTFSINN